MPTTVFPESGETLKEVVRGCCNGYKDTEVRGVKCKDGVKKNKQMWFTEKVVSMAGLFENQAPCPFFDLRLALSYFDTGQVSPPHRIHRLM